MKKSKSKKHKTTKITKKVSKKHKTTKKVSKKVIKKKAPLTTLPVPTILYHILEWVDTEDLITHLTTHAINKDLWQAEWEADDRKHFLNTGKDNCFRAISKAQKTKMRAKLKFWNGCHTKLTKITKMFKEINALYQQMNLKQYRSIPLPPSY